MIERIKQHLEERDAINAELETIMGHSNDSPINIMWLEMQWGIYKDSLHLQVGDDDMEEDYYEYEISSLGALGEQLFIGEKDGYTYVMAHDGDWEKTQIFVLNNKNKQ
jgi:hypothetical protein